MNLIFLPLLLAHFIADFWLQPSSWVKDKTKNGIKSKKLILHALIAALLPTLLTFNIQYWWFFPVIFVAHYFTDLIKVKFKENLFVFVFDQLIHISTIFALSLFVTENIISNQHTIYWITAIGLVLATSPAGIFTGIFLKQITKAKNEDHKLNASAWIGIFERLLIIVFILSTEFQAIGFLIAAKSIFRFNEAQKDNNKKAEYFLLGTLVSFTIALAISFGIKFCIKHIS